MATIDDLNISISNMVYEEAFALVKRLRESRRIKKGKFSKPRASSSPRTPKKPKDLLTMLTPEQKAILLETLEGG